MRYYHGTTYKDIGVLRKDTYVTEYPEDALMFAIPWDSKDVDWNKSENNSDGRPPKHLVLKPGVNIDDNPIYLYALDNPPVKRAATNKGGVYDWNRQLTRDYPAELILVVDGWKEMLDVGVYEFLKRHPVLESYEPLPQYLRW